MLPSGEAKLHGYILLYWLTVAQHRLFLIPFNRPFLPHWQLSEYWKNAGYSENSNMLLTAPLRMGILSVCKIN